MFNGISLRVLDIQAGYKLLEIRIGEDNQTCKAVAQQPRMSDLFKQIDINIQFLISHVQKMDVNLRP